MKFRNFGRTALASAVSAVLCLGVTSCNYSFTVGYLYATVNSPSNSSVGQISGFRVDNNSGRLLPISGTPFSSGGANPIRIKVANGSRFVYVLNAGDSQTPGTVTQFSIGGYGSLSQQGAAVYSRGQNPVSMTINGNYLLVLDQQVPASDTARLGLGDVTVFSIDPNTGRLSLVLNQQLKDSQGNQLTYFPVGPKPIDMAVASSYLYVVDGDQTVFPYAMNAGTGQLTVTPTGAQPTNAARITAIGTGGSTVYLLDAGTAPGTTPSQVLAYAASNGSLQALPSGNTAQDPLAVNPQVMTVAQKGTVVYVANGPNPNTTQPSTVITGYKITNGLLVTTPGSPYHTGGASPRCILEDTSGQYLYIGSFSDSKITGQIINTSDGELRNLRSGATDFSAAGQVTWCDIVAAR